MLRSLNSGVTGLMNHQTRMDVIGNNISNVNTTGYKGRRVTFEESFNQLIKGASRTASKAGGTNPMQVGLGVSVGSIDVMTGQGGLSNTGRIFDLAIEGSAYFGVSDGAGTFYTRNGAFQLDSQGYIMLPTNGMVLQGRMANTFGDFPPGTAIGNLQIPMNQQAPARETTEISIGRNLNADADSKGSISYTQPLLHPADGTRAAGANSANDPGKVPTPLSALFNSSGKNLGIKENDILTISWYDQATIVSGVTMPANKVAVSVGREAGQVWDIEQFVQEIENALNGGPTPTTHTVSLEADGSLKVTLSSPAGDIFYLQINSSNPESDSYVNNAFNFGAYMGDGIGNYPPTPGGEASTGVLLRPAEQFDYMDALRDASGREIYPGLEGGDPIDLFGSVGKTSIEKQKSDPLIFIPRFNPDGTPYPIPSGSNPTLLDDLMAKMRNDLKLPAEYVDRDGRHLPSVHMDTSDTDDGIPAGAIVIRGAKGVDFSVNNLTIQAKNSDSDQVTPASFNSAMRITEQRKGQDLASIDVVIPVYDESGAEHTLTMTFVHTGKAGEWEWRASFAGKQEIIPGTGTGKISFGQDGTVSSFLFDGGGSQLMVDPRNGSNIMHINLNIGGPGDHRGITQFASASTINCTGQDGYPTGNLVEVSIDEFGLIEGSFSNGTARSIAQILLVDFANPGGLLDLTDSVYTTSANSGDPVWGMPNSQSSSKLKPGALEMANVDLAGEFTNMITTQRGYQANSRIVTVSDSMLEELVNLKR